MDNPENPFYLSGVLPVPPVEEIVDNPRFLVDKLWISAELSTTSTYPQFYPQTYPQVLPLLSTGLSTIYMAIYSFNNLKCGLAQILIHMLGQLSTVSVDNCLKLWINNRYLSTVSR